MTIPQPTVPPAGWYTDPSGQPGQRWWDGASWTATTQPTPVTAAVQIPVPQAEPAQSLVAQQPYGSQNSTFSQALNSARPAGWYPDGTTYGQQRWWDGNQWTAQVSAPYQGGQGMSLQAPAGTSPYNMQIWAIVGIYAVLSLAEVGYIFSILSDPFGVSSYTSTSTFFALGITVFALIGWGAAVLLAAADGRELRSRGVSNPFHWAFTFIPSYGPTIYIIGRSVVARRRTGSGLAPIWVHFGVAAGCTLLGIAVLFSVISSMSPMYGNGYGY